jgi:SulP family sulfate permease
LHALSGEQLKSNVERSKYHRDALEELGKQIYILELQGYIFFGTANALLDQVRARVRQDEKPAVRFVILDFRRVSGLDASAIFSFVKCKQFAEAQQFHLILTGVSDQIQQQLDLGGLFNGDQWVHLFVDLDHGLEWCEDQLLMVEGISTIFIPLTLGERLIEAGFQRGEAERLLTYLERIDFEQGDRLIHQGDQAGDVYLLERGKASIYLEIEKDKQVRLQTLGKRTIVGEVGFYLGGSRTASVVAESPGVAYRLSRAALAEIEKIDPELAAAFHCYVARLLAERLADTTRLLAAMSD